MGSTVYRQSTAAQKLAGFFPDATVAEITPSQALTTVGKDPDDTKARQWLRDTLRFMAPYGYIEKVMRHNSAGALSITSLKITPAGLAALNRPQNTPPKEQISDQHVSTTATVEQVHRDVRSLREQFPGLDIVFTISLKEPS